MRGQKFRHPTATGFVPVPHLLPEINGLLRVVSGPCHEEKAYMVRLGLLLADEWEHNGPLICKTHRNHDTSGGLWAESLLLEYLFFVASVLRNINCLQQQLKGPIS